jgi:hypothetical protein
MKPAMTEAPSLQGGMGWVSPFFRILRGVGLVWVALMLM